MTAICPGGGPSGPKDGFEAPLYLTVAAIGAFFNRIGMPWILSFVGQLGAQQMDPDSFCASDPPADPGMTALDWANVLNVGAPALNTAALIKFAQLLRHYLWYEVCECISATTPAAPAPLSPPSGLPTVNPPAVGPTYPTGQPCRVYDTDDVLVGPGSPTYSIGPVAVPPGLSYITLDATLDPPEDGITEQVAVNVFFFNTSGGFLGTRSLGWTTGQTTSHSEGTVPTGTATYRIDFTTTNLARNHSLVSHIALYCGTTPGGDGETPQPCPTDPITLALLQQILDYVRLIQRQEVPFAYVTSTVHSGLTGQGEITVQGLVGVRVLLTSIGGGVGAQDGDPDALWGAGWINWGNADGFSNRIFIGSSPMVSLPRSAGQYTRLGYSLGVGVTAEITELVREP